MNYKRHKPRTQVKCTYCTDNRIGNSGRIKNLEDEWRPVPAKYPVWYCKKLKGKHDFVLKKVEEFWVIPGIYHTLICRSCGKKKIKQVS